MLAGLPAHRNAGEGEHRQAAHRLAEEAGRLKDAEQQQVLDLRTGGLVGGSGDDAIVVYAARAVDISLHHHRAGDGADLVLARAA